MQKMMILAAVSAAVLSGCAQYKTVTPSTTPDPAVCSEGFLKSYDGVTGAVRAYEQQATGGIVPEKKFRDDILAACSPFLSRYSEASCKIEKPQPGVAATAAGSDVKMICLKAEKLPVQSFSVSGNGIDDGKAIPKGKPATDGGQPPLSAKPMPVKPEVKPTPATTPKQPGQPSQPQQPKDCSPEYMLAYRDLVTAIGALNESIKAGKTPDPTTAAKACDSIESKYPGVVCRVNDPEIPEKPTIATKDAERVCQQIRAIAARTTPSQPQPPKPTEPTEPQKPTDVQACTKDYVEAYVGVATKIATVAEAVQKRDIEAVRASVPAAQAACADIAKKHAGHVCGAANQSGAQETIQTDDFKEDCGTIDQLAKNIARLPTQPQQPTAPPAEPGTKAMCTRPYIETYIKTMQTLQTFGKYYQAGQPPPNVPESLAACRGIQKQYAEMACQIARPGSGQLVDLSTADFSKACMIVEKVAKDSGQDTATNPGEPKVITEASAVSEVEAAKLKMSVANAPAVQKAVDQPKGVYFIDGKAYSLQDSLSVEAPVRCTIERLGSKPLAIEAGKKLTGKAIEAAFASGLSTTKIQFNEEGLSLECSSSKQGRLTLGELKATLKGILDVTVEK